MVISIRYGCQIWYQFGTQLTREKVDKLQKKTLHIITFKDFREPSSPLFKDWKILKMRDLVEMQNCLHSYSFLKGNLSEPSQQFFQICCGIHRTPTRPINSECLYMPQVRSITYSMNSITNNSIHSWNNFAQILESPSTLPLSEIKCRIQRKNDSNDSFKFFAWYNLELHCWIGCCLSPLPPSFYFSFNELRLLLQFWHYKVQAGKSHS